MTYIFATGTDYHKNNLTGAHLRFLELVSGIEEDNNIILISSGIPTLLHKRNIHNIELMPRMKRMPSHIAYMISLYRTLIKEKDQFSYDYAISFHPTTTICYGLVGLKHIVSLFREDLIGYKRAINAKKLNIKYFEFQEHLAVKYSEKIIVQCKNDKIHLIERNKTYCPDIEKKVDIQINNVNASWMKFNNNRRKQNEDCTIRILFIGNFNDIRKGHAELLPAVTRLLDEGYDLELYIAGDGRQYKRYKEQYKSYVNIHFLGRVARTDYYLSICDFEIVPSLIDSCPNTVLEGINAGIAVYGAKTGGIPDLLMKDKYMFVPEEKEIYQFLKKVIDRKRYIQDSIDQASIRQALTFNWSESILRKITDR